MQFPGAERLHPKEERRAGRRREAGAKERSQQGLLLNGLAWMQRKLAGVRTALSLAPIFSPAITKQAESEEAVARKGWSQRVEPGGAPMQLCSVDLAVMGKSMGCVQSGYNTELVLLQKFLPRTSSCGRQQEPGDCSQSMQ